MTTEAPTAQPDQFVQQQPTPEEVNAAITLEQVAQINYLQNRLLELQVLIARLRAENERLQATTPPPPGPVS